MDTIEESLEQVSTLENRKCPRLKCNIAADCSTLRGLWTCTIVDMSERGMGIVSSSKLQKGSVLDFNDPRTKAQVVWVEENRAGLRFIN
jgi:hypothetical protein